MIPVHLVFCGGCGLLVASGTLLWGGRLGTLWHRLRGGRGAGRLRPAFDMFDRRGRRREEDAFDRDVIEWMDMLYVAASCGLNLPDAVAQTAPMAGSRLHPVLAHSLARHAVGDSLLEGLARDLEAGGGESGEVAWLLVDSVRDGLPLASALAELRGHMVRRRRSEVGAHLRTLGLRITLVTVFLLFPPAFVLIVLPNLLTFLTG